MAQKQTIILYHGDCPDGFGAAYAAWKKFGDSAEYIPVKYGRPAPELEPGRDVFVVDFCYPKEVMDALAANTKTFTVLDHHQGIREVVESFPNHVYDASRSGATIAWGYFHPDTPVPIILQYVQAGDLYTFELPNSRAVLSYLYTKPFHFDAWDAMREELEDPEKQARAIARGEIYFEYYSLMVEKMASRAELVEFDNREVYLGSANSLFNSDVGHVLAKKQGPFALIAGIAHDGIRVSLRGDGSVDVSAIARAHGGNGHPNAAAFFVPWGTPLPWKSIAKHAHSGD